MQSELTFNQRASRRCKVVEIWRYKKNKPPQHEYLVARLQCQDGEKRYVSIERSSQSVDAATGVPILSQKQMTFVSNCANSVSSTSGRGCFLRRHIQRFMDFVDPASG